MTGIKGTKPQTRKAIPAQFMVKYDKSVPVQANNGKTPKK